MFIFAENLLLNENFRIQKWNIFRIAEIPYIELKRLNSIKFLSAFLVHPQNGKKEIILNIKYGGNIYILFGIKNQRQCLKQQ